MLYNQNNLSVAKFASKSETRPELAGVFFTADKTVATDGFRLVEMTVPADVKPEEYPKVGGATAMRGVKPFILSAKLLNNVKVPKNKNLPILNNVAVCHADDEAVTLLTSDDGQTSREMKLRKIDGTFPDYKPLIPTGEPVAEVSINAEMLAEVLMVLSKLSNLHDVKLAMYGEGKPLVITAGGVNQSGLGLVMPLRS